MRSDTARSAVIVGAYEHPLRFAPHMSTAQLHRECAKGALHDAGLTFADVDGYFSGRDAPGMNGSWMADFMNIRPRHYDTTDAGGCSYIIHLVHAVHAIEAGRCSVALIVLAGRPRSEGVQTGIQPRHVDIDLPDASWEAPYRPTLVANYALVAARHMYQYGTTSEQLASVRVAASHHAQHNANAMHRAKVSVADVLASPMISDPLHRLDCCVISDGGGAIVVVSNEIAQGLKRPVIRLEGAGECLQSQNAGYFDITASGASVSGARAFAEAGRSPADVQYASIYDSFTITVLIQLEALGFCAVGDGGRFVSDGNLISGVGSLPVNTDGGGLCNNHPGNRGGMTKLIEAIRQLRGEAVPEVQVPGCQTALVCGTGGRIGAGHMHATVILSRHA